jgi:hypothetical protein
MRFFQVEAAEGAEVFLIATTDTASEAVIKLTDALDRHARAWATDETGTDVSMEDLIARARQERGTS